MSENARPDPSQPAPAATTVDGDAEAIAAAFEAPPEAAEGHPARATGEPPPDEDDADKELLVLPASADEPPIYFEPDAVASPFLPAVTPPPSASNVSRELTDPGATAPPRADPAPRLDAAPLQVDPAGHADSAQIAPVAQQESATASGAVGLPDEAPPASAAVPAGTSLENALLQGASSEGSAPEVARPASAPRITDAPSNGVSANGAAAFPSAAAVSAAVEAEGPSSAIPVTTPVAAAPPEPAAPPAPVAPADVDAHEARGPASVPASQPSGAAPLAEPAPASVRASPAAASPAPAAAPVASGGAVPPPPPSRRTSQLFERLDHAPDSMEAPATERSSAPPPPSWTDSVPLHESQPGGDATRSAVSHSTSVPPPRVRTNAGRSQRPGSTPSPRASGLIAPARIIAVLGSEVPAYSEKGTSGDDEIEDLDDSEAEELIESAPSERTPRHAAREAAQSARLDAREHAAPSSRGDVAAPAAQPDAAHKRAKPPSPPSARAAKKAAAEAANTKPWWEDMFSDDFLRAIPVLSPSQLERETAFVARSLNAPKGSRLLDLACGAGQHAVELAARGYQVLGFDLSEAQLAWARELAQERVQTLELVHGDMRELDYDGVFAGVYCWNTSFGFFDEDKNVDIARRVFRALRPGGRFLLDVVNRDFIVSQQPGQTWFEGDGCVCIDDVNIDFSTSRIKVKRTLMLDNGRNRECNYSIRLYNLHELSKLLVGVGFNVLQVSGRPELPGVFMGPTSPRIIVLAAKPAE